MANSFRTMVLAALAVLLLGVLPAFADPARFDLAGPKVEVRVTRDGVTLPIAQVPNLRAGDKLWLHPDFPPSQSVKYLLVCAFLRGTTNPPPDNWFTRIETWNRDVKEEGVFITVPNEAQQVILFLAPETGGDFNTLRSAVKGSPGIFVRASQDLNEAGFEQARIEKYLDEMKTVNAGDPKAIQEHSALLARTLALKPNDACFKQSVDQQYACLTQAGNQLLLDDGHGQTVAEALSNGPSSDLIQATSYTAVAGGGVYSAYVGAIVDAVRLTAMLHTAQYRYIPAIAFPSKEQLNLRLNAAPSFHNPKSVIVIGLPAIQAAVPPPLRAADAKQVACLLKPNLVLGVEGAPLVFSTALAHELVLHINSPANLPDIPLAPDAFRGGLIVAPKPEREILPLAQQETKAETRIDHAREKELDKDIVTQPVTQPADTKAPESKPAEAEPAQPPAPAAPAAAKFDASAFPPGQLTGTVSGMWGFDHFTGPTLPLQNVPGKGWKLVTTDPLIVGQDNHLVLASSGTACVEAILADSVPGKETKLDWKPAEGPSAKPDQLALNLPLPSLNTDTVELSIKQFGDTALDHVTAKTFAEPAKLAGLSLHAGDTTALLLGTNLDQVKQLELKGLIFTPATTQDAAAKDHLQLALDPKASDAKAIDSKTDTPKLNPGDKLTATATLKDGRTLTLQTTIDSPRPVITLLSKGVERVGSDQTRPSPIKLSPDDLPLDDKLTFFIKSAENFPRAETVEIASTVDDGIKTTLSISAGTLILQNKHTVLATLEPLKTFGPSAFGPLHLRAVAPDGTTGDWIPLATLVRLPTLTDLHCPTHSRQQPCTLEGSNLYLVDSFSTDQAFTAPVEVPEGFVGSSVTIPHPAEAAPHQSDTTFYVRLRDDPAATDTVTLPILPVPTPAASVPASSPAPTTAQQTPPTK
jgi:hypothetical protein